MNKISLCHFMCIDLWGNCGYNIYNSSARDDTRMKIVLARIFIRVPSLRERPLMSKSSREATKSAKGAILRMGAAERPSPVKRGRG